MDDLTHLEMISPVDGRYSNYTQSLSNIFSESGLIRNRLHVELEYLIYLSEHPIIGTRQFDVKEKEFLRKICDSSLEELALVKEIEINGYGKIKRTNHDVKAVEYFIREKLTNTSLEDSVELIHFGLTSEDTNNLAYSLMLRKGIENVFLPSITKLTTKIEQIAEEYKEIPMLARTHGQPASPSTFGKEFKVYSSRLNRQIDQLKQLEILVKLNGATGNFNAHHVAYPNLDLIEFSSDFINRFNNEDSKIKFKPNLLTTQIESHDSYSEIFDNIRRINTILIGFNQDMWRYISDEWLIQATNIGEVGSSTMPHKINPINFENSEGNLGIANALFNYFSSKLPISRLQRDLSDSTVQRNFGVAFAHSIIGYGYANNGINKISVNETKVIEELEKHPEVITEAIQTILRRENVPMPYEQLSELTRGKKVSMKDLHKFIDELIIKDSVKQELKQITPTNYIGIAKLLCDRT